MTSALINRTSEKENENENIKDNSTTKVTPKKIQNDGAEFNIERETTPPPRSGGNKGFINRIPIYTKSNKETSPSLLDTFTETSHIRESRFWGFSKFLTVTTVYWMISNLYRQYCEKESLLIKSL